jgi:hypothetical protein
MQTALNDAMAEFNRKFEIAKSKNKELKDQLEKFQKESNPTQSHENDEATNNLTQPPSAHTPSMAEEVEEQVQQIGCVGSRFRQRVCPRHSIGQSRLTDGTRAATRVSHCMPKVPSSHVVDDRFFRAST